MGEVIILKKDLKLLYHNLTNKSFDFNFLEQQLSKTQSIGLIKIDLLHH